MTSVDSNDVVRATLLRRIIETGGRVVRTLDFREPSWVRPLPRVGIRMGRWVPAWVVHVAAAATAVGCIAMVASSRPQWILASILVALMLVRPSGAPPALFALWLGLQVATSEHEGYTLAASGLVLGLHLIAVLLTTVADLGLGTRIELRVFAGPLRRLLSIQVLVQPVTWATMTLAAGSVTVRWLPAVAALGVALAVWAFVRRVRPTA